MYLWHLHNTTLLDPVQVSRSGESGRRGREGGREGRKTVAGAGQIDAENPCHLAITRRRGFVPENTAIARSLASRYATHAFLFLIMSVRRPGPHSDSDDSDRARRQPTQISGKVPKANETTRQGIRIANGTMGQ